MMIQCDTCKHQHHPETIEKHGGCPNRPRLWDCLICHLKHRSSSKTCPRLNVVIRTDVVTRDTPAWDRINRTYKAIIADIVPEDGIHLTDLYRNIRARLGERNTRGLTLNDLVNGVLYRQKYRVDRLGKDVWDLWVYRPGDKRGKLIGWKTT